MFDVWGDAACEAVAKIGLDPSVGNGFDLANMVLLSIMKCDVYRDIFRGYDFECCGEIGESRIRTPFKGYSNELISAFEREFLDANKTYVKKVPHSTPDLIRAISMLPEDLKVKLSSPDKSVISLRVIAKSPRITTPAQHVISASNMSLGDYGHLTKTLGHMYFSTTNNEDFIIAENVAGVIGVLSLFRHQDDGKLSMLSISGISVTPAYRKLGIATALVETATNHAKNLKIPLVITSPSKEGKGTIYKKTISEICYKDALIFEPFFCAFSAVFNDLELDYNEKVQLLNWLKGQADQRYNIDYSSKCFDDRDVIAGLKRELRHQALYIRLKSI